MAFSRLIGRKELVVLGLNSGTSADGLDLAALKIKRTKNGIETGFLCGGRKRFPPKIRELVLTTADSSQIRAGQLILLDNLLGQFFGRAAAGFIRRMAANKVTVDLVASHGQTVRHVPRKVRLLGFTLHGSMQLGSLDQIAASTGRVAVGDFRQADIALGNEGAPITGDAMARLFSHPDESRVIINIGGMSNFFYFPARGVRRRAYAADCGPGNSLSDLLSDRLFGEQYDRNGRRALAGSVHRRVLSMCLAEPFFDGGTASTGREEFGVAMAERIISLGEELRLSGEDMLATAAELTVSSIVRKVRPLMQQDRTLRKMYLTGGGAHNRFLSQRLAILLEGRDICSVKQLGISPDLVEAAAYAVMGEACLRSEAAQTSVGRVVSRARQPILGRIAQPPKRA